MPRYKISIYGQVFKLEDSVPYSYSFRDRKWFETEEAAEHFFDGTGSWEATGKEVITTIRENNNMDFQLTKGTLSKLKKEDLIALMYAEDGAMGSPGEIMALPHLVEASPLAHSIRSRASCAQRSISSIGQGS